VPEVKIKFPAPNGEMIDASDVPITLANEHWNEYKLEDGTTLRVKFTVGSIIRLDGVRDPENNPVYSVKGTVVTIPVVPASGGSN
jgi:hypothetical protein